ncbi:Porin subfamily protein [Methylobacterium phyllostachyos]|uniref:Porin subfamily protein n=1 Tax=Methylobacterium phyllostachyos TaxID=582672 RepID=A0A1G9R1K3_9HYPH|nr:porin [Methylobacterium phyllostachyos]SDM17166.1 Porin subfamily protein [Methylobacterium phyllostachyos]
MGGRVLPLIAVAAVVALSPAMAGDLPKAPVTPGAVPCPSKGQGFVRLPGSESCVRVSGRVAAGMDVRAGHGAATAPLVAGRLAIDNRTDTDLGEVRTYVRIGNGRR